MRPWTAPTTSGLENTGYGCVSEVQAHFQRTLTSVERSTFDGLLTSLGLLLEEDRTRAFPFFWSRARAARSCACPQWSNTFPYGNVSEVGWPKK